MKIMTSSLMNNAASIATCAGCTRKSGHRTRVEDIYHPGGVSRTFCIADVYYTGRHL